MLGLFPSSDTVLDFKEHTYLWGGEGRLKHMLAL
jgi:hypothetical protein